MDIQQIQTEKQRLQQHLENLIYEFETKTNTIVSEIVFAPSTQSDMLIESSEEPVLLVKTAPSVKVKVAL